MLVAIVLSAVRAPCPLYELGQGKKIVAPLILENSGLSHPAMVQAALTTYPFVKVVTPFYKPAPY